jgi:Ni/Co efflux regulator RcnB
MWLLPGNSFLAKGCRESPVNRKRLFAATAVAALLLGGAGALADPPGDRGHGQDKAREDGGQDRGNRDGYGDARGNNPKDQGRHDNGRHRGWEKQAYRRGERLPERYSSSEYYVTDYQRYHLREPERGYRWVRDDDDGQFILVAVATGIITDIILGH